MTEKIIVISTTKGRRNPMYSPVHELNMGFLPSVEMTFWSCATVSVGRLLRYDTLDHSNTPIFHHSIIPTFHPSPSFPNKFFLTSFIKFYNFRLPLLKERWQFFLNLIKQLELTICPMQILFI